MDLRHLAQLADLLFVSHPSLDEQIDVSGGDKIPRKGGPGISQSDLLIVNKVRLALLREGERSRAGAGLSEGSAESADSLDFASLLHPDRRYLHKR